MIQYCKTCGLRKDTTCLFTGCAVDLNKDFCSRHVKDPYKCEICTKIVINPVLDCVDETIHILCESCSQKIGSCVTCHEKKHCKFFEDPTQIPTHIQKEIRQGNMVSVIQVKNPERIRETCQKGCICFDPENGCLRETISYCDAWRYPTNE